MLVEILSDGYRGVEIRGVKAVEMLFCTDTARHKCEGGEGNESLFKALHNVLWFKVKVDYFSGSRMSTL